MFSQSQGEDVWLERGRTYQAQENFYSNRTPDPTWVTNDNMTIKSFKKSKSIHLGNLSEIGSRK